MGAVVVSWTLLYYYALYNANAWSHVLVCKRGNVTDGELLKSV